MTGEELIGLILYLGWWLLTAIFSFHGLVIMLLVLILVLLMMGMPTLGEDIRRLHYKGVYEVRDLLKEIKCELEELNRK